MKWLLFAAVIAGLVAGGCKKNDEPPPSAPAAPAEPAPATDAVPPPPPDPSAPPQDAPPPEEPAGPYEAPKEFETLNSNLREHIDGGNPAPKTLDDIVRLKIVPKLPAAPPGKKLVYDPKRQKVILANQ